jgi:hypothetical protein
MVSIDSIHLEKHEMQEARVLQGTARCNLELQYTVQGFGENLTDIWSWLIHKTAGWIRI